MDNDLGDKIEVKEEALETSNDEEISEEDEILINGLQKDLVCLPSVVIQ